MKVTEYLAQAKKPIISLEVLPPPKGKSIESIYKTLDPLMEFKPSFVNVTYHRAEQVYKKRKDGTFESVEIRKRPGTVGICAAIMGKYKVEAIPHLICGGFSKEETENALIDLNFLGVQNVLALRGDAASNEKFFVPHPKGHKYAEDLVGQIIELNKGKYIEDDIINGTNTDFCIGVAGYPEKHFEAPNLDVDLYYLKRKIDLGADYITTQMFFNNKHFYDFSEKCKQQGINAPIIPGLKPLYNHNQLSVVPRIFNTEIPTDLFKEMQNAKTPEACEKVGEDWLYEQCKDLLNNNVPVLHFYTLGKPHVVYNVLKRLF
ncbi:MAG: methylenetetrahydrofolate reductase [NAD(P)H] [Chitinophagales bacterium]|nr:methylenetetrahydrofolate reductase [NAD(P)H] [Chitinophagales bacterium]